MLEHFATHLLEFFSSFSGWSAYFAVFAALMICAIGIPIPEDITLASAGFIAYLGGANVYLMIALCMFGVLFGDSMIFIFGAKYGIWVLEHPKLSRFLHVDRIDRVKKLLGKHGNKMIFAARFMPGFRMPMYLSCGMLGVKYRTFFLFDGLASLLSVPAIVYLVFHYGDKLEWIIKRIQTAEQTVLIVILTLIALFLMKVAVSGFLRRRGISP